MDKTLAQDAISYALSGDWKSAIEVNQEILQENPEDTDALNRLARAYAETGSLKKANTTAKKVLEIDPFNTIANKAIDKWKLLKKTDSPKTSTTSMEVFLEEPGKTKIISLLHLGDQNILAQLDSGDKVSLNAHGHKCSVTSSDGKYIGKLPDDLSARLRKLIKYGNEYSAHIKSVNKNDVKIFIRETKRSKKLADVPSFTGEKIDYISFTPPELVHKKGEIVNTSLEAEDEE